MFPSRYTIFEPITVGVSSAAEAVLTSKRTDINDVIFITHSAADVLSLSSNFEVGKSFTAAKAVIADSTTPTLMFTKKGTTPFSTSISNNGSRLVFEHVPLFGVNEPYHTGNKPTLLELGAAANSHTHTAADLPAYPTLDSLGALSRNYLSGRSTATANISPDGISLHYIHPAATGKPTGTDHALLTLAYSSVWSVQLAGDWRTNNWYVRNQADGAWGGWAQLITSANIASQSVNYAASAGNAGNSAAIGGIGGWSTSAWAGAHGYPGYTFSGGNTRFGFSSTGGTCDVYCDGNFYAGDACYPVVHAGNIASQSVSYAASAGAVAWENVTGKPSTFTPAAHTHTAIGGLTAVAKGNGTAMQFGDTSSGTYQLYSTGGQLYLARIG